MTRGKGLKLHQGKFKLDFIGYSQKRLSGIETSCVGNCLQQSTGNSNAVQYVYCVINKKLIKN